MAFEGGKLRTSHNLPKIRACLRHLGFLEGSQSPSPGVAD